MTTQKVDRDDPVCGFVHRWIEAFAEHWDEIIVVCLGEGAHSLPKNVRVYSLGKVSGGTDAPPIAGFARVVARARFIAHFKRFAWRLRHDYDSVFVHQNPEYVLIAGILWRFLGKRIALWYNHPAWNWRVRLASLLAHTVFYTSPHSSTARLKKAFQMPVGIDTDEFQPDPSAPRHPRSVLSLGRISHYKRIHVILGALESLRARGVDFFASVYGSKIPEEGKYFAAMRARMAELERARLLSYSPGIPHAQTPFLFTSHAVFVNASQSGNFDKTILEAMACGTPVLTCNADLRSVVPPECFFREGDEEDLARALERVLTLTASEREQMGEALREYVVANHTLASLARRVAAFLSRE